MLKKFIENLNIQSKFIHQSFIYSSVSQQFTQSSLNLSSRLTAVKMRLVFHIKLQKTVRKLLKNSQVHIAWPSMAKFI